LKEEFAMSIKDRLTKKTGDLVGSAALTTKPDASASTSHIAEDRTPRTGPGQMLAFRSHMQESNQRVKELEDKLLIFADTVPVKALDPKIIHSSKWANRHEMSFLTPEFKMLKLDIETANGNVQPIRVRPLANRTGHYEIIFGHRRHQACLQLNIPVSAIIDSVSDKQLFASMDRENRARADLSAFEQGEMYRRALDEGLYSSLRQMAQELGIDPGNASKAIAIARLPEQVLAAFESPTLIQYRWGQELLAAIQKDPDGVIARAKTIRFNAKQLPPAEALDKMIGRLKITKPSESDIKCNGKSVGKISVKPDGACQIILKRGAVTQESAKRLVSIIEGALFPKMED
jgi:ParB family transcriptional regulator, chromosome partitioning protein